MLRHPPDTSDRPSEPLELAMPDLLPQARISKTDGCMGFHEFMRFSPGATGEPQRLPECVGSVGRVSWHTETTYLHPKSSEIAWKPSGNHPTTLGVSQKRPNRNFWNFQKKWYIFKKTGIFECQLPDRSHMMNQMLVRHNHLLHQRTATNLWHSLVPI